MKIYTLILVQNGKAHYTIGKVANCLSSTILVPKGNLEDSRRNYSSQKLFNKHKVFYLNCEDKSNAAPDLESLQSQTGILFSVYFEARFKIVSSSKEQGIILNCGRVVHNL